MPFISSINIKYMKYMELVYKLQTSLRVYLYIELKVNCNCNMLERKY